MMRLFIAVPITDKARRQIEGLAGELEGEFEGGGARFMPPENWHFTLVFLGEQNEEVIKRVVSGLDLEGGLGRVDIEKVSYGPPGPRARMIWLCIDRETSGRLGAVRDLISGELERGGVRWQKDRRVYNGHLTLARFSPTPISRLSKLDENFTCSFEAPSVDLMRSTLTREGAIYEKVCGFELSH